MWTPGTGVTDYQLWLGTTGVGSQNLYDSGATKATTVIVSGLPTNGVTVYARLWSEISGAWQSADLTYREAGTPVLPVLTTPAPASVLSGSSVAFTWSAGAGPVAYQLYLGTTGVGSHNLYESGSTKATTVTVSGLPTCGATMYARLWWEIDAAWKFADYTYTESGVPVPPVLTTPAPRSVLSGSSVAFTWSAGAGPAAYQLYLGTTGVGSSNLYDSRSTTGTAETVSGLPANGVTVFARLWWEIGGAWKSADYTYTESGTPVLPVLTTPAPGSVLSGSSVTLTWSAGAGPAAYQLWLGTTGVGSQNLYDSGSTKATTVTVSGLPTNGVKVYARLWWEIDAAWHSADYTYTESGPPAALSALSCSTGSMMGSGTDSCTVTLSAAAPSGGLSVSVSSGNAAVAVPATVTVPANATSAGFTATVSSVATAQTVTLTASTGSVSETFVLQLNVEAPAISSAASASGMVGSGFSYQTTATNTPTSYGATGLPAGMKVSSGTGLISGTPTAAGTSTATLSATNSAGTGNATLTLTIAAATPTITWAAPAAITYGTALSTTQLDASSTVAGTFSYSPAAGTVLTAGSHAITATFTPTDSTDYATATSSVSITVNAATPAITWAAPAAITYGTALSSTQLDASSTIPGTFVYSPVAGTVLAVGSQTLSVTFTPTDTTDYTTATQTVILTVNSTSSFVQEAASTTSGSANSLTLSFAANTFAGDLILVGFDFSAGTTPSSVTDSQGNTFTPVGTQLPSPAGAQSVVYYAKNIKGGADTVTVTISANATFIELYLTEYSGIDRTNPIDAQAGASGGAGPVSSGNATTNFAGDVIYGYCPGDEACTAGSGFATRSIFDGNVIEDQTSGNPGSYAATGSATSGWTMHMVALKPASSLLVEAPAITSATSASGTVGSAFSYQITATNTPVSYGATGLAAGLTINSGTGLITGTPTTAGTSTATLSATNSAGTGNATLTLTIAAATPTISWAAPAAITYGTALSSTQLDASSTVAGTFSYSPAAGTVLTAGSHAITATFTPTDSTDYATATSSVSITVNAATPAITWAAPAAITYGTALSSTQLDASSTIPGTFVYSPVAGTVLAVGSQTLSVTFTPTDATDYTTATQTVILTVNSTSSFVQEAASTTSGSANSLTLSFAANTFAGDLILVGFDFSAGTTPSSVTDSQGNTFTPVGTQLPSPAGAQSVVYYAKNIKGGADTVTVTISANATFIELYLTEYSGIDRTNPIDAQAGASGGAGPVSSGNATTNFAGDVIYGYCPGDEACTAGSGFATRSIFDGNVIEDQTSGNPGSYAATGSATSGWTMHMVALKPASSLLVEAPAITSATSASGTVGSAFSYQITATNTPVSYGATGLAAGLTINSGTGLITGTPTTAGTSTATLSATNSAGTGNATLTLTIAAPVPGITSATTASATVGSAFSYQITASNTPSSYGATSLPTGLTVNTSSGLISGTPTAAGTSTVTLSATNGAGTGSATLTLTIAAAGPTLSINATSVGFGNVGLNTPATQSVTLTSTGTAAVTVNSAVLTALTGTGFTFSGPTLPVTLTPTQVATLEVQFDPTAAGAATAQLTITSTSSTNGTAVIALTGTGTAASYAVDLSWDAPSSSTDPVAGYNVYRSPSGSSTYVLLNSSVDALTTYVDSTVLDGTTYDYIVESVDSSGVESVPTSPITVPIP
jgi:hypothetical protein